MLNDRLTVLYNKSLSSNQTTALLDLLTLNRDANIAVLVHWDYITFLNNVQLISTTTATACGFISNVQQEVNTL